MAALSEAHWPGAAVFVNSVGLFAFSVGGRLLTVLATAPWLVWV